MLDRIFNQRLDGQYRNFGFQQVIANLNGGCQLRPQPQTFNFKICLDDLEFLFQSDEGPVRTEKIAEHICKVQNKASCFGVVAGNGAVKGVQRIEEKMRVDLCLQSSQFSFRCEGMHLEMAPALN